MLATDKTLTQSKMKYWLVYMIGEGSICVLIRNIDEFQNSCVCIAINLKFFNKNSFNLIKNIRNVHSITS